ncbi:hypothetical protein ACFW7K_30805 [Streptomyces sp. NPDC058735]|uniref:effector-associated constant component EACC1 n=1 Tax=Streptomyces sp. NPDC058735 TaxID=3346616 RepID=UPI0036B3CE83
MSAARARRSSAVTATAPHHRNGADGSVPCRSGGGVRHGRCLERAADPAARPGGPTAAAGAALVVWLQNRRSHMTVTIDRPDGTQLVVPRRRSGR